MADYSLEELKTILINLINSIGNSSDLIGTPWGTMMEFMSRWEEVQEFLDNLGNLQPAPSPPSPGLPAANAFTMLKLTRCRMAAIAGGGRWEASHTLKGMVVMVVDDLPVSLWYCTGEEWRRAGDMGPEMNAAYGVIKDGATLAYKRGDVKMTPLTNIEDVRGANYELSIGTQVVDKYHAVGIITAVLLPEFEPTVSEPTAVITTWIGEADGTNIFTNDVEPEEPEEEAPEEPEEEAPEEPEEEAPETPEEEAKPTFPEPMT
jgi:hypothetical protein